MPCTFSYTHKVVKEQCRAGPLRATVAQTAFFHTVLSPELAVASQERRQLDGPVKSSFSMNVVGEDKEKLDSTALF